MGKKVNPIILLASERSGSNLLRVLFGNHSKICAPVAPQLCSAFMPVLNQYGRLNEAPNAVRLLRHMMAYSQHEFSDWQLKTSAEELFEKYRPVSFLQCLHALYQARTDVDGKATYFSKENDLQFYAAAWSREYPDSTFVYLARDPRDVAASWKKRPQEYTLTTYLASTRWAEEQRVYANLVDAFNLPVCSVTYEALINDPATEMTRLLEFCGLEAEEACFQTQPERNTEAHTSEYWKNLARPIMKGNSKKYKQALSDEEIRIIESLGKDWMSRLDYPFETEADWCADRRFRKKHKRERRKLKKQHGESMAAFMDKHIASRQQLLNELLAE